MYDYIKGKIKNIQSNSVTLECNGIGFLIYTPNPYAFKMDIEYTIYLYQYVREDEISLYGFMKEEERSLFLKLIDVKGLGCKMALPMLALGSTDGIVDAIERENILYLKKFPKIGDKVARQIILDLKGKLDGGSNLFNQQKDYTELIEVLKGLGYKQSDINKILSSVDNDLAIENQVKEALKLLLK